MLLVAMAVASIASCRQILEIHERDVDAGGPSEDASANDSGDAGADGDAADGDACPFAVCGLVAPQCGCPPGRACHGSIGDQHYCGAAGDKTEGEGCDAGECLPGYECAPMFGVCARNCEKALDCGEHSVCRYYSWVGHYLYGLCTPKCDLVTSKGCPRGTKCTDLANSLFECGPIGTVSEGGSCVSDDDCDLGLACLGASPTGSVCRRWCHIGSDECTCDLYLNLPKVDGKEYGLCSIPF